ncbi:MAG TPA: fibrobacter succinogenes major paralogous domain-containing protein [Bacteroidales bacterium]|nr:fibrobacter succinogenes major paralogous domain-containing protein [Bacteroidales bacterium]
MKSVYRPVIALLILSIASYAAIGQGISVNKTGAPPDSSAILDIQSTSQGVLFPRMSTWKIRNIQDPETGLMVFNTDSLELYIFTGQKWESVRDKTDTITTWECGQEFLYGGQAYSTVLIGTQCWMSENLNIGVRVEGTVEQHDNDTIEKYCYNNDPANCDVYGGLYQWAEVVQYLNGATNFTSWDPAPEGPVRGICPEDWHIPSYGEWMELVVYCDYWGGRLKETGTEHWFPPNTDANNESGFTAFPGGYRHPSNGGYAEFRYMGTLWSTTGYEPYETYSVYFIRLYFNNGGITWAIGIEKSWGFSVRCVMDN